MQGFERPLEGAFENAPAGGRLEEVEESHGEGRGDDEVHEPADLRPVGPLDRQVEQEAALAHGQREDHHRRDLHVYV